MMTQAEIERTIERNQHWLGVPAPRHAAPSLLGEELRSEALVLIIANIVGALLIVLLVLGATATPRSERPATIRSTHPGAPAVHPVDIAVPPLIGARGTGLETSAIFS